MRITADPSQCLRKTCNNCIEIFGPDCMPHLLNGGLIIPESQTLDAQLQNQIYELTYNQRPENCIYVNSQ